MGEVREVRVVMTEEASSLLQEVRATGRERLTLVIGNGCCDSTAPFLFEDYLYGPGQVEVGELGGVPVVLDEPLVPLFSGYETVIGVGEGPDPDSFSCESELGRRFTLERIPLP